ncbi:GNAT family N-acetyltransferase [Sphingomonas sp. EC-HK361]|uniref:GNAT family N-acetyltransferase n=1 Tax=Sphingomonas sp. EC-HK361 TaxID=2038397 RepID=UPI00125830D3|nr:GNAT family N-acetyltransferase [Sphingomonas sp. EC-HK361]VVS96714.1 GNAT family N-acetyltransferase [Sphingomonas sp. EC-HK361]
MSTKIRFAERGDVTTILRFVRELAEYERAADKVVATEALLADALFSAPPAAEALIAEVDGAPVGMALFFHNFSTWTGWRGLYLEDLYVTPAARGAGVGKALLKRLARIATDRGCARFEWSVLTWNTPAIDFYRSLGAETLEEWRINRVTGEALEWLADGG